MFLHYLGNVNSSNILQITTDKIKKCLEFDKNETFMLSYGCIEIGILFSTAYARSARRSPAQRRYSTTRQLHCPWQWLTLYICWCHTHDRDIHTSHIAHGMHMALPAWLDWIGLSSVLRPLQHSIGYMGDGFYRTLNINFANNKSVFIGQSAMHTTSRSADCGY